MNQIRNGTHDQCDRYATWMKSVNSTGAVFTWITVKNTLFGSVSM